MNRTFAQVLRLGSVIALLTLGSLVVTGQAKFANGSASAPSIAFTNATNTGIYLDRYTTGTQGAYGVIGVSSSGTRIAAFAPTSTSFYTRVFANAGVTTTVVSSTLASFINTTSTSLGVTGTTILGYTTATQITANHVSSTRLCLGNNLTECVYVINSGQVYYPGAMRVDGALTIIGATADLSNATTLINVHRPTVNNAYDIGTGALSYANLHASGTAFMRNVSSTNATTTFLAVLNPPAAGTGLNPFCKASNGMLVEGAGGVCPVSALEVKDVIGKSEYGLDELMETEFVNYRFKGSLDDGRVHTGPVADWLLKNMPNLVLWRDGKVLGYDYVSMIAILGQSIKDLSAKQDHRMDQMQKEIDNLKLQLAK